MELLLFRVKYCSIWLWINNYNHYVTNLQKELRKWLDSVAAEQDVPVLWDEEKPLSKYPQCAFIFVEYHIMR
jgi:hypothetical protein